MEIRLKILEFVNSEEWEPLNFIQSTVSNIHRIIYSLKGN